MNTYRNRTCKVNPRFNSEELDYFLGQWGKYDLYVDCMHMHGGSLIARYGNKPREYLCTTAEILFKGILMGHEHLNGERSATMEVFYRAYRKIPEFKARFQFKPLPFDKTLKA